MSDPSEIWKSFKDEFVAMVHDSKYGLIDIIVDLTSKVDPGTRNVENEFDAQNLLLEIISLFEKGENELSRRKESFTQIFNKWSDLFNKRQNPELIELSSDDGMLIAFEKYNFSLYIFT